MINHTNALRDVHADKTEVEKMIADERQREGDMLASECHDLLLRPMVHNYGYGVRKLTG